MAFESDDVSILRTRNMGMDADIADNVIELISNVRRELRLAQQELETVADSHLREEMTPATRAA